MTAPAQSPTVSEAEVEAALKILLSDFEVHRRLVVEALTAAAKVRAENTTAPEGWKYFSEANRARCESPHGFNHSLHGWDTSDWFLAILGELGEAANVGKKLNRVRDGIPGNKQSPVELQNNLRKELGDTLVYLDLTAQAHGFNILDAAIEVFNAKSVEIGYPVELAAAPSPALNRDALLDEVVKAAEPFAKLTDNTDPSWANERRIVTLTINLDNLRVGDARRLRTALQAVAKSGEAK